MRRRALWALVLVVVLAGAAHVSAQEPAPAGTDLLTLDVWVGDTRGRPVADLGPQDFAVEVEGRTRPVRATEYIDYRASAEPMRTAGAGGGRGPAESEGRVIAVVVDDLSFDQLDASPLTDGAAQFVARLHPADRIAVFFTSGRQGTPTLSPDRAAAAEALRRVPGQRPVAPIQREVTIEQILAGSAYKEAAFDIERAAAYQLEALTNVLRWLETMRGPRAMVLVSGGVALPGGPAYLSSGLSAARRAGIATFAVTTELARETVADSDDEDAVIRTANDDFLKNGLDQVVDRLEGRTLRATTDVDAAFSEIEDALSGFYRIGVEVPDEEALPPSTQVGVSVRRDGLRVRAGSRVVPEPERTFPVTRVQRLRQVLSGNEAASELPFEDALIVARDSTGSRIALTTTLAVPESVSGPIDATFVVVDEAGAEVTAGTSRLAQVEAGAYRASVGIPVPIGRYSLRVAVIDAEGRVGSVERAVLARLRPIGPYDAGDPQLAWRVGADEAWRLMTGDTLPDPATAVAVNFEVFGDAASVPPPAFELSMVDEQQAVVASTSLTAVEIAGGWRVSSEIRVDGLPPGAYRLRLTARQPTDGPTPASTVDVRFRKVTPARVASGAAAGSPSLELPSPELFFGSLRGDLFATWPRFDIADVLSADSARALVTDVATAARVAVPAALRSAATEAEWWAAVERTGRGTGAIASLCRVFLALRNGDSAAARAAISQAMSQTPDTVTLMLVSGAAHARQGRDADATSAWSMAAGLRAVGPQWTVALVEALGRQNDLAGALEVLQKVDAGSSRLVERRVQALILLGRNDEAASEIEAALAAGSAADESLLFLAVALAFGQVLDPAATPEMLRTFEVRAQRYLTGSGEHAETVQNWLRAVSR